MAFGQKAPELPSSANVWGGVVENGHPAYGMEAYLDEARRTMTSSVASL